MAWFLVTPDFMTTLGASVIRGRDVTTRDVTSSPWVAVVNQTAARQLWPDREPLGRQLRLADVPDERPREIVAVVADIPLTVPVEHARGAVYLPYLQQPDRYPLPGANRLGQMTFMIRTAGDPRLLATAVREAVHEVDPGRTIENVSTMEEQLRSRVPDRAGFLLVIGQFAAAATLLAAVGLYGIVSYTTVLRTREIGVRVALGAATSDVVTLVSRRAVWLVSVGLVAGVAGALVATRLLHRQLFDITPTDPLTYAAAVLLLTMVSLVACALPTRRATRVDPTTALRCE
jgi:putative ABC transport system permease protein